MKYLNGIIGALCFVFALGCGVRGDPLPPEKPTELGRGRPTYKRATEKIKIPTAQKQKKDKWDATDKEDEESPKKDWENE